MEVIIKGGPGSGHFGHRGRPGEVGGSLPGSLRTSGVINQNFFRSSTWRKLTSKWSNEDRKKLEEALVAGNISSNHLLGLKEFAPGIPLTTEQLAKINGEVLGLYDSSTLTVHLNRDVMGGFTPATVLHELGHHIQEVAPWRRGNNLFASVWRRIMLPDEGGLGLLGAGEDPNYDFVLKYGYKMYSLSSPDELFADTYKLAMWRRGFQNKSRYMIRPTWVDDLPKFFDEQVGILKNDPDYYGEFDWYNSFDDIFNIPEPRSWVIQQANKQVIIKGGPGSGHFGHVGRPGKVGGSLPGSLRTPIALNPNFFKSSTWRKLTKGLPANTRNILARAMRDSGVASNHLHGLSRITTEGHPEAHPWNSVYSLLNGVRAYYHRYDKSIHLNPLDLETGNRFPPAVFLHELGHHIHQSMTPYSRIAMIDFHNKLRIELSRNYGVEAGIEVPPKAKEFIYSLGLRVNSMNSVAEFVADVYSVGRMASLGDSKAQGFYSNLNEKLDLETPRFSGTGVIAELDDLFILETR